MLKHVLYALKGSFELVLVMLVISLAYAVFSWGGLLALGVLSLLALYFRYKYNLSRLYLLKDRLVTYNKRLEGLKTEFYALKMLSNPSKDEELRTKAIESEAKQIQTEMKELVEISGFKSLIEGMS